MRSRIVLEKNIKPKEKNGICGIIFSKDRAMQLEALFSSIRDNAAGFFNELYVVYKATDRKYRYSYEVIKEDYPEVNFIKEVDFQLNIESCLETRCRFTMFLTDDDIIFRPINRQCLTMLDSRVICFSFRLGVNISYCYSNDKPNRLNAFYESGDFIAWDWTKEELDFAYPLSVTAHLFRTKVIKNLLEDIYYPSPNIMEGKLQSKLNQIPNIMVANEYSSIVGVPANRVNIDTNNRNGLSHPYSTQELNEMFRSNKRIDISQMDFSKINACQQELPYVFV